MITHLLSHHIINGLCVGVLTQLWAKSKHDPVPLQGIALKMTTTEAQMAIGRNLLQDKTAGLWPPYGLWGFYMCMFVCNAVHYAPNVQLWSHNSALAILHMTLNSRVCAFVCACVCVCVILVQACWVHRHTICSVPSAQAASAACRPSCTPTHKHTQTHTLSRPAGPLKTPSQPTPKSHQCCLVMIAVLLQKTKS